LRSHSIFTSRSDGRNVAGVALGALVMPRRMHGVAPASGVGCTLQVGCMRIMRGRTGGRWRGLNSLRARRIIVLYINAGNLLSFSSLSV
jgi:hypothetical protein